MAASENRIPLRNHRPRKLPRGSDAGAVDLSKRAEVTVVVRSRGSEREWAALVEELTSGPPKQRRYLTHAEYARAWGASPADVAAVKKFGAAQGLKVVSSDAFRRCVVLSGTLRQLARAFGVDFFAVAHPLGTFRSHRGTPQVTESIHPIVECVLGLDNVPSAHHHLVAPLTGGVPRLARRELLAAYQFPPRLRGQGQCVAIIELGGGYQLRDYKQYFELLGLAPPPLRVKRVGDAKNDPAAPAAIRAYWSQVQSGHVTQPPAPRVMNQIMWTVETMMDLQIVGTMAPEASLLLIQAPNDDQGEYHAITSVIADRKDAPSVLSCSWGSFEDAQTPALMPALDRWFQAAAVLGISVCFSSGDYGDGAMGTRRFNVYFPASSPHVLTVGGTTLHPKSGNETAWHQKMAGMPCGGGGGFSRVFARPPWQQQIRPEQWIPPDCSAGKGRAIPDVAAKADFDTAFPVVVGGIEVSAGGTSAAVPLWGGLMAVLNQGLRQRAGSIGRLFYGGELRAGLRDVTHGNTGCFCAAPGWDACTGWGTPKGQALLQALKASYHTAS